MNALRQRGTRFLSVIFFAALLLVPLLESGHSHLDRDLAKPCATCVVAHHSPATTTPTVVLTIVVAFATLAVATAFTSPARLARSPQYGRAPPAPFSDRV